MKVEDMLKQARRVGDEVIALCPFHDDHNPSFAFNTRKGLWVCYGCGARGNARQLTERIGGAWSSRSTIDEDISAILKALQPQESELPDETELRRFEVPNNYWTESRGFRSVTVRAWELGYDSELHAGTIPVRDIAGRYVGVILRMIDPGKGPKYLYPRGFRKSEVLYGAHLAKRHDRFVLVEGALDAVACWDVGIPAVAMLGASISAEQAQIIRQMGPEMVLVATDNDEAGRRGALQVMGALAPIVPTARWSWGNSPHKDLADLEPGERLTRLQRLILGWKLDLG